MLFISIFIDLLLYEKKKKVLIGLVEYFKTENPV